MPTPHKHAELIKAWADGAQIQVLIDKCLPSGTVGQTWKDFGIGIAPGWIPSFQYRIKPEPQSYTCWIHTAHQHLIFSDPGNSKQYKRCTVTIHPDE